MPEDRQQLITTTPFEERQADVDKRIRSDILDVITMPAGDLHNLDQEIANMPAYKAMWVRTLQEATKQKPDLRACEFVQEHVMGKAVQKTVNVKKVLTYQDVLHKTKSAEQKFQEAKKALEQPVDVQVIEPEQKPEPDWSSLL